MAKVRVLKGVAFTGPDVPLAERMERIARRDGTDFSPLMVELARSYVQAHENGNAVVPLTKFAEHPGMVALPTIGEPLRSDEMSEMSDDDFEVLLKAAKARYQEVIAEAKRRGWWVDRDGRYERRRKH